MLWSRPCFLLFSFFQLRFVPHSCAASADRVGFYVTRSRATNVIKIDRNQSEIDASWSLELTFWAFDKPCDGCVPITVYETHNGHGLSQYGHENISFWFFAFDDNHHPSLRSASPTLYSVHYIAVNNSFSIKHENTAISSSDTFSEDSLLFTFYAFEHNDKYLSDIHIENCMDNNPKSENETLCTLIPQFHPQIYNYYVIAPDNVYKMYLNTTPSEAVSILYNDVSFLLSEQEQLQKQVTEIIDYKAGPFENRQSINLEEGFQMLSAFYNQDEINNDTVRLFVNQSVFEWVFDFVSDDNNVGLIDKMYNELKLQIHSFTNPKISDGDMETLSSDGLLYQPWTPVTVDIHYDLHVYRIFVVRKSGQTDVDKFKDVMSMNIESFLNTNKCPKVSLDAAVQFEMNELWHRIRVWVVSLSIFLVMSTYILYDRYRYHKLVQRHSERRQETF